MTIKTRTLIEPYGGKLVNLVVDPQERDALKDHASRLPSIQVSDRAECDLELLACGAFSPLDRFMGPEDFHRVVHEMRLANGMIFPIPVTLSVDNDAPVSLDREVALRDSRYNLLGVMTVESIYEWDRATVSRQVFGTDDARHPLVSEMYRWGARNLSGRLQMLQLPIHHDFRELRLTPAQTRARLGSFGRENVVAFQTRNPLHRVHEELTKRAIEETDGVMLLHPVVGMTKAGDVDHFTRVRTYRALADKYYEPNRILLALLPLAMRMAGPREALWHAIIRQNYGANHLIVGRDHASPGKDSKGNPFYGPYDAQELLESHQDEIKVKMVPFRELVFLTSEQRYEEATKVPAGAEVASISGTQVREEYLNNGKMLPEWFTRPEVATILGEAYPPRHQQGACLWLTGLSCSGKSTTAEILTVMLQEHGRHVTLLDGDVVRTHLSKGLGFSAEDRDINIRRIGFVASQIVRHGGLAICAAISPYRATRNDVRNMMKEAEFIEIFVDTPLEVCEQRDVKGIYAKARRGEIRHFTGIDDPYEAPHNPELRIETVGRDPEENARGILTFLIQQGLVRSPYGPSNGN
ncbi:MAG: bifunctional sulfate adenylyltransferase/adenylylsulfate kinase [Armatimonadetes bacterium]|nr:bifunctional sulfate adenylyltransferase/adenylylsulfate kinase [Armatimonadota bacterium]